MEPTPPFTIRCETPKMLAQMDALAQAMDRSRSWVVNQALKEYVSNNLWQIQAIEEGIASLDAGESTPHETVMARLQRNLPLEQ